MGSNKILITGIFGMLGAVVLFIGDMLFYYNGNSSDLLQNMAATSNYRIQLSALTALFATWFYLVGLWQVYGAFKPSTALVRNTIIISFAMILTAYGVIHGAYVAIAISAKSSAQNGLYPDQATNLAIATNNLMRLFVYPPFAVLSFLFIKQVWKQKSYYPRWIIFFFPLIPFLFFDVIYNSLQGSLKTIIGGGFFNLILLLFFTASTIALWRKK